jgi:hypothetical protein
MNMEKTLEPVSIDFLEIIKWIGTACVIIAATCRAFEFHTVDLLVSILGAGLWGYAAVVMKDKALFVVNVFVVCILIVGVVV